MQAPITYSFYAPQVVVFDGERAHAFTSGYRGEEGTPLRPIEKAATVATLRALADQLEIARDQS